MPIKTKTMVVTSGWPALNSADRYRVEQVTDSIEPKPGDMLEAKEVQLFCDNVHWKVTVKPNPNGTR